MRLLAYAVSSVTLAAAVIAKAYLLHPQFYPAAIYLYKSNASTMILLNFCLCMMLVASRLLQMLLLGPLRAIEVEHLYERSWFAVSETFLAMTIFRDEFDSQFVVLFTLLLAVKCFHWLAQDRINFMEQSPPTSKWFHYRMVTLLTLLLVVDAWWVQYAVGRLQREGASVMIMFGFEYAIYLFEGLASACKYGLNVVELQQPVTPWEHKSTYLFYCDLLFDFLKLTAYLCFFVIILRYYGLPIHIIRDLYLTLRQFMVRIRDWLRYRRATANMQFRYPDATEHDLTSGDPTCIICREEMVLGGQPVEGAAAGATPATDANTVPKKLPCGHMFHFRCLRSWLERQQSCPTCRRSVFEAAPPATPIARANAGNGNENGGAAGVGNPPIPPAQQAAVPPPRLANLTPPVLPQSSSSSGSTTSSTSTSTSTSSSTSRSSPAQSTPSHSQASTSYVAPQLIPLPELIPLVQAIRPPTGTSSTATARDTEAIARALTDEQLCRFRGTEVQHIRERVRYLLQVEDQVSALVQQLTQYASVLDAVVDLPASTSVSDSATSPTGHPRPRAEQETPAVPEERQE